MAKNRSLMIAIIGIVVISLFVPIILSNSKTLESQATMQIERENIAGQAGGVFTKTYCCQLLAVSESGASPDLKGEAFHMYFDHCMTARNPSYPNVKIDKYDCNKAS